MRARWRAGGLFAVVLVLVVTVLPACTAAPLSTEGGCPELMDEFLFRAGDSVSGNNDRPHLRQAWETWSAQLDASGLLDICKGDAEDGLPTTPPLMAAIGEAVRVRPVVPSPFDPEGSIAAQVVYVTQTAGGERAYAMTLVAIAADDLLGNTQPDQVVFTHGTAGIHRECDQALDTTYSARFLRTLRNTSAVALSDVAESLLDQGLVVQAPYYVGIGTTWSKPASPYLSRDTTGRAVIDGVRAVDDLMAGGRWGVVGHSQGGHAALAAARLAPTYGAGTELAGAVASAPPIDPEATLDYWLDALAAEPGGTDPRPSDGALPPDSPTVLTLVAHVLWGLSQEFGGFPAPSTMLNRFYAYDARQSILLNSLGDLNPLAASLQNSGDPPAWNPTYGMYTSGPSAVPSNVPLLSPSVSDLVVGFRDLDWEHTPWSIPTEDRMTVGCGWPSNGAPGGVLYQYAATYISGQMQYPAGVWGVGLPMMLKGVYQDPDDPVWDGIRAALSAQSLEDQAISGPLLVMSGDADSLFPTGPPGTTEPHTVRAAVAAMCAAGSEVELIHDATADHGGVLPALYDEASQWLIDRLAGVPADPGASCTGL